MFTQKSTTRSDSVSELTAAAVADLQARLQGELLQRSDPGYDEARTLWGQFAHYSALFNLQGSKTMNQLFVRPNRSFVQVGLRRVLTAAIVVVSLFALARPGHAADVTPPEVPANLAVPPGNVLVRVGHATGTQNYVCLSSGEGVTFTLFTPQATLFDAEGGQIMTHFFGPNPIENGTTRAAWQDSKDTSTVWGKVQASSTDPAYVAPGAIPWLLVAVVGNQNGPTGGDRLAQTTFIQRVHTAGGMAPSTGCSSPADVGNRAYVPYVTDYYFFRAKSN